MKKSILILFLMSACFLFSCKEKQKKDKVEVKKGVTLPEVKKMTVKILSQLPHEGKNKYVQGLEIKDGILYESAGLYDQSCVKKIELKTGKLIISKDIPEVFAEGLTLFNDYITVLTYREGIAETYNISDLSEKGVRFTYEGEGWGLTNDGEMLIMSDGSDRLFFRNPYSFKVEKVLNITIRGRPLYYLNELEYVDGKIYANVYGLNIIFGIDAKTGMVLEEIDASNLSCSMLSGTNSEAVLNGIAYDKDSKTFWVTGKECPTIYQVVFE